MTVKTIAKPSQPKSFPPFLLGAAATVDQINKKGEGGGGVNRQYQFNCKIFLIYIYIFFYFFFKGLYFQEKIIFIAKNSVMTKDLRKFKRISK